MIKFEWKSLVKSLKELGFNARYQTIIDENNDIIDDEVAIYDTDNRTQLFYITDAEFSTLNDNNNYDFDLELLKNEVVKFIPNIDIKL